MQKPQSWLCYFVPVLAAPMYFVEERTIGPSLGQDNIQKGIFLYPSRLLTRVLIYDYFFIVYLVLIANIALDFNLWWFLAIMSLIGSALTLPGIAGIVLTIEDGGGCQRADIWTHPRRVYQRRQTQICDCGGFNRAFTSILMRSWLPWLSHLFYLRLGTGPIKGFAVTLAIGIASSIFTSVTVTRALVQLIMATAKHCQTPKYWLER